MDGAFPAPPQLWTFLLASLVLAATPGPGVLYIVARSVAHSQRAGLASAAGVALGNLGNVLGASIGLAALLSLSAGAFTAVRWAGAAYLVVLGLQAWLQPASLDGQAAQVPATSTTRLFRDGFWVALLNPKTALFFGAFLPQFMGGLPSALANHAAFTLCLGALFVMIAAVTDCVYALAAGAVQPLLQAHGRWRRFGARLSGSVLMALGVLTACSDASSESHTR
jgi:threonine/homoserine/homoserine lactone efflux protein